MAYSAALTRDGRRHALIGGQGVVSVPATLRLRAEAPGYLPQTLSPFLDNPPLVEAVTRLEEKDLTDWQTYKRLQEMLGEIQLTFRLEKQ